MSAQAVPSTPFLQDSRSVSHHRAPNDRSLQEVTNTAGFPLHGAVMASGSAAGFGRQLRQAQDSALQFPNNDPIERIAIRRNRFQSGTLGERNSRRTRNGDAGRRLAL
eukprot:gene9958-10113_t